MWIVTAWEQISPEVILKGVQKCCISNTMDGTNDDCCEWGQCKEDDGTDSEDGYSDTGR